jgi:hypothetical protein
MSSLLRVIVTDPDPDYLGIDIVASGNRFSGAAKIYAGLHQLNEFADVIEGFPKNWKDERTYTFGTKDKGVAGGFCELRFYCRDRAGHVAVEVELEDDDRYYSEAFAKFALFPVVAAELDKFVRELRSVERTRTGEARLENRG